MQMGTPTVAPADEAPCQPVQVGRVGPERDVAIDAPLQITMTLSANCQGQAIGLHAAIVMDARDSMLQDRRLELQKQGATQFATNALGVNPHPDTRIGVWQFADTSTRNTPLVNQLNRVLTAITRIRAAGPGTGRMTEALGDAREDLQGINRPGTASAMILAVGGGPPDQDVMNDVTEELRKSIQFGFKVIVIEAGTLSPDRRLCYGYLVGYPATRYYCRAPEDVPDVWNAEVQLLTKQQLDQVDIDDLLPAELDYVLGSADPIQPGGRDKQLIWQAGPDRFPVKYQLQPLRPGCYPISAPDYPSTILTFSAGGRFRFPMPVPTVCVSELTATPSPTRGVSPTATQRVRPTVTGTLPFVVETETPTPHVTDTPVDGAPHAVYLPFVDGGAR
jgi:hypothetical protein